MPKLKSEELESRVVEFCLNKPKTTLLIEYLTITPHAERDKHSFSRSIENFSPEDEPPSFLGQALFNLVFLDGSKPTIVIAGLAIDKLLMQKNNERLNKLAMETRQGDQEFQTICEWFYKNSLEMALFQNEQTSSFAEGLIQEFLAFLQNETPSDQFLESLKTKELPDDDTESCAQLRALAMQIAALAQLREHCDNLTDVESQKRKILGRNAYAVCCKATSDLYIPNPGFTMHKDSLPSMTRHTAYFFTKWAHEPHRDSLFAYTMGFAHAVQALTPENMLALKITNDKAPRTNVLSPLRPCVLGLLSYGLSLLLVPLITPGLGSALTAISLVLLAAAVCYSGWQFMKTIQAVVREHDNHLAPGKFKENIPELSRVVGFFADHSKNAASDRVGNLGSFKSHNHRSRIG